MAILYRFLLFSYPARFRRRFRQEMGLAFLEGWSSARGLQALSF